jgi:internalin A
LSRTGARWRTGVLLDFENCRGLVVADIQDKKVLIYIAGTQAGRQRLLAIIRSDLEGINSSFSFKPKEIIPVSDMPGLSVDYQELLMFERNGYETTDVIRNGKVYKLDIVGLLNGIDLKDKYTRVQDHITKESEINLFYSYSRKDELLRENLETHLKILNRQGLIQSWYDRDIDAGEDWQNEINSHLEHADIILLLISADFIASDYCYELEMERALEREEKGEVHIIPIIVRAVNWQTSPVAKYNVLPKGGEPVTSWLNQDEAWTDVAQGIEKVVKKIRAKL